MASSDDTPALGALAVAADMAAFAIVFGTAVRAFSWVDADEATGADASAVAVGAILKVCVVLTGLSRLTIKALFCACVSRLWAWSVGRGAAVERLFTLVTWCE